MDGGERESALLQTPEEPRPRGEGAICEHPPKACEYTADGAVHEDMIVPCGMALPRSRVVGYTFREAQLSGIHAVCASRAWEGRQCHTESKHRSVGGEARLERGLESRRKGPASHR